MGNWFTDFLDGWKKRNYVPPKPQVKPRLKKKPRSDISIPPRARGWAGIVWHHSASVDTELNNWKAINRYHTSYRIDGHIVSQKVFERRKEKKDGKRFERPWSDIGYHGGIERVRGKLKWKLGRPWTRSGAHAGIKGNSHFNKTYLGLCCVGNFDKKAPDAETWGMILDVTRMISERFKIPRANVWGHREVYDYFGMPREKTCPGRKWDMDKLRREM